MFLLVPNRIAIDPKTFTLQTALVCRAVSTAEIRSGTRMKNGEDEDRKPQCIPGQWSHGFLSSGGQLATKRVSSRRIARRQRWIITNASKLVFQLRSVSRGDACRNPPAQRATFQVLCSQSLQCDFWQRTRSGRTIFIEFENGRPKNDRVIDADDGSK